MAKHYPLAPSSLARIVNCPGSRHAESEGGAAADHGTALHAIAANSVRFGAPLPDTLEPEDRTTIERYVRFVVEFGDRPVVETTLTSTTIEGFGGTPDAVLAPGPELHVIDLKTGEVAVAARENVQLGAYLLLARQNYPDAERFYGHIVQKHTGVDSAQFSTEWLDDLERRIAQAAEHDYRAAGEHCEWCPLLATCREGREHHLAIVQDALEAEDDASLQAMPSNVALMLLDHETAIERLLGEAKKRVLGMLASGQDVPGFRVYGRRPPRRWSDFDEVANRLGEDTVYNRVGVSPAQLQKADSTAYEAVEDLVECGEAVPTLKRDKRVRSRKDDFDD